MIRRHFHLPHSWGPRLRPVGVLNSCRRVSGSRAAGQAGYRSPNPEVPTDMGLPNGAPPEAGMLGWSWTVSKHIQHYQIIIRLLQPNLFLVRSTQETPPQKKERSYWTWELYEDSMQSMAMASNRSCVLQHLLSVCRCQVPSAS